MPRALLATILFEDIADSTETAMRMGDHEWTSLLAKHHTEADSIISGHTGRLVKTTGDGVLAVFDDPVRAIQAAHAIQESALKLGLKTRSGLHAGEIEVTGVDIAGISVHIAARTMGCAAKGEVLVTKTVRDICAGSGITFEHAGCHALKGLPQEWDLYRASLKGER